MAAGPGIPDLVPAVRGYARLDDRRVFAARLGGDLEAREALIDRYRGFIYASLRKAGLSPADADDTFQDVCLTLYSHL